MSEAKRKLASVQMITAINPIDGADRIEVAQVLGWQVVIKKGQFLLGDKVIYLEVDSLLPDKYWSEFLKDKNKPEKQARLKTIRLRGQLSQGLIIPLVSLAEHDFDVADIYDLSIGDDLTDVMGITKYEAPVPVGFGGNILRRRPEVVPKTDELRVQSFPDIVDELQGKDVYFSTKVDGSSGTFVWNNEQFDVCSRNWSIGEDDVNVFWQVARTNRILDKLKELGDRFALQGEVAGPGIQKNHLQLPEVQLFAFNIYDIQEGKYLDCCEFIQACDALEIPMVPDIVTMVTFKWSMEELIEMAKGNYVGTKNPREGIVIRPMIGYRSEALGGARASIKVINNDFLLKGGD